MNDTCLIINANNIGHQYGYMIWLYAKTKSKFFSWPELRCLPSSRSWVCWLLHQACPPGSINIIMTTIIIQKLVCQIELWSSSASPATPPWLWFHNNHHQDQNHHHDHDQHHDDDDEKANEWGKRYQFWSCADVDIMPPNNFAQVNSHDDSWWWLWSGFMLTQLLAKFQSLHLA